ncbi:MAG: CCC motif membrane protein [Bacteroidetes bacterium]|nr:CCC motif membrane protein [Bacteroidota bacterium]
MGEQAFNSSTQAENANNTLFQQNLPNSNTILVLGILSIVFCWWHLVSFIGIVMGIITLVLAKREIAVYTSAPQKYTLSSLNNVKTGRTCAIIGLIISIVIFVLATLFLIGFLATLPFWGMIR